MIGKNDLQTPEDDFGHLDTREPEAQPEKPKPAKKLGPTAELTALRERVTRARKMRPPRGFHCRDCFGKARDAVLTFVEGEE